MLALPHAHQAKKSKHPKTRKLTSQVKKYKFFVSGRYKVLKLMGMGIHPSCSKTVRCYIIPTASLV
ncbi:hypothetical protein CN558_12630 [Bacillus wiedmannii]|uniref:Uncharacterized protein n=1 Tax=Bacillus wiedmannii TaxID=1890302 RepID=A0A2A8CCM8_9BACI|nr:hypothetical protein CN609_27585 [Bacillus wiedmannii]PEM81522.1 hypothetical protein CN627_28360 [Bacillus wiedmannii]PEO86088.1 hypothetical protein CN558_12630 [Bacillus wiedmannii]PGD61731.1 hypothetical protein COM41_23445 [Bacillus wiedmannii]PHG56791.1 hypothetical protein COI65_24870 [Bacillus wiedmannii]